jgi:tRNA (Thr-GGU) A37 N-methylase
MPDHLLVFLVGSLVVTVVPGADMALITRQVVTVDGTPIVDVKPVLSSDVGER